MMKKYFKSLILAITVLFGAVCISGCGSNSNTVAVVKPKKHLFHYNPKWHKKTKRTKVVRYKNKGYVDKHTRQDRKADKEQ